MAHAGSHRVRNQLEAIIRSRKFVPLMAFVGLMGITAVASAHGFAEKFADSRTHTWYTSETGFADLSLFYNRIVDVTENEYDDKTDLTLFEDDCHLNCYSGSAPHVDVSWWATNLAVGLGGTASCDIVYASDSTRCDHWHVVLDNDAGQSSSSMRQKVCHEWAHTVGFRDSGVSLAPYGCLGGGSSNAGVLDTIWHERQHIDSKY